MIIDRIKKIGNYRLLREIGRGGMGIVYEAEQISLGRRVALKLLPQACALSGKRLQRFRNEAQAAATLQHPHIVPVHEFGMENGTYYYAMQLIEGESLAELLAERRCEAEFSLLEEASAAGGLLLSTAETGETTPSLRGGSDVEEAVQKGEQRIKAPRTAADIARVATWGIEAARALDFAHQMGVVHRDIKPSNLLVDNAGKLWVTDFGLAMTETDADITQTGEAPGTLQYMSPEQSLGNRRVVDHRTDIYSLGATLYELLTLHPLRDCRDRIELLQHISQSEPIPPRTLNRALPRDLETILLKALERDPLQRYQTAEELAEDLRRHLRDEPILALRPKPWEVVARWSSRHLQLLAIAAGIALLTMVGLATGMLLIARERDAARIAAGIAQQASSEAQRQRQSAIEHRDLATYNQYVADMHLALQDWKGGGLKRMDALLAAHLPDADQPDHRGWEWHYLHGLASDSAVTTIKPASGSAAWTAWSPDGSMLAVGGGHVEIWRPGDAAPLRTLERFPSGRSSPDKWRGPLAWSPDGTMLAIASGGMVEIWDPLTATLLFCLSAQEQPICRLCWSPDGKQLATGDELGAIRLWEASAGAKPVVRRGRVSCVLSLAWSPDGRWLAVGDNHRGMLDVWDVVAQELAHSNHAHDHFIRGLAWSPDGRRLATGSNDQHVKVWNTHDWTIAYDLPDHLGCVNGLAWSPDGRWLATGSNDCIVRIWDATTGSYQNALRGHRGEVIDVSWEPNGERIAAAGAPGTVKVWNAFARQDARVAAVRAPAAWHPDRRSIVAGSAEQGVAKILDVAEWRVHKELRTSTHGSFRGFDWSPTGREVAACDFSGQVVVWDVASGQEVWKVEGAAKGLPLETTEVRSIAWSPDGTQVATGGWDKSVHIREANTGRLLRSLSGFDERVGSVMWSPDGTRLAAKDCGDKLVIWNAHSWQVDLTMRCHDERLFAADGARSLAWSPEGERLAAGTSQGKLVLWNVHTGQRLSTFGGHTAGIRAVAWSPDGTRLASGGEDRMLRIYDATTGKELLTLDCEKTWIHTVAWSTDGSRLMAGNQEIRVWDAPGMRQGRRPTLAPHALAR